MVDICLFCSADVVFSVMVHFSDPGWYVFNHELNITVMENYLYQLKVIGYCVPLI